MKARLVHSHHLCKEGGHIPVCFPKGECRQMNWLSCTAMLLWYLVLRLIHAKVNTINKRPNTYCVNEWNTNKHITVLSTEQYSNTVWSTEQYYTTLLSTEQYSVPWSPHASILVTGGTWVYPSSVRVCRWEDVRGWSHMYVFIAGQ